MTKSNKNLNPLKTEITFREVNVCLFVCCANKVEQKSLKSVRKVWYFFCCSWGDKDPSFCVVSSDEGEDGDDDDDDDDDEDYVDLLWQHRTN